MAFSAFTVQVADGFGNQTQNLSGKYFLDQVEFGFTFYSTKFPDLSTGESLEYWYMDLIDSNNEPIVRGIGIVAGIDILYPYRGYNVPAGKIFVVTQQQDLFDPTQSTFADGTAQLWYQPAADVAALGVSQ